MSETAASSHFFLPQVYVKNNLFKIPAGVLLPEDKVKESDLL